MFNETRSYWNQVDVLQGSNIKKGDGGGIVIIGSGLSGVSVAYWLTELAKDFFDKITIIDNSPTIAASFRNCGHILHGPVESMAALTSLYSEDKAANIWKFSVDLCNEVKNTINKQNLKCDYKQNGYLVIANQESEVKEI